MISLMVLSLAEVLCFCVISGACFFQNYTENLNYIISSNGNWTIQCINSTISNVLCLNGSWSDLCLDEG